MYTYIMWTHSFLPFLLFSLYWAGASCLPELSSPSWFLLWFLLSFFDCYCPLMAILSYAVFEAGMRPQILLPEETNFLNGECLPHTLEVWEIPTMLYPHRSSICLHNLKTPELQLSCWREVPVAIKCDMPRERAKRLQRFTHLLDAQSHWSPELFSVDVTGGSPANMHFSIWVEPPGACQYFILWSPTPLVLFSFSGCQEPNWCSLICGWFLWLIGQWWGERQFCSSI